jgi:adenylate cyclase
MSVQESARRLSAVFFADIVGFTALTALNESAAIQLVDLLQRLSYQIIERTHRGRVVKFIGDATLAEFGSADAAVRAALTLQKEYRKAAEAMGATGLLRIAVHLGEVIASADGDIYGDGVNTASRLEAHTRAGNVTVSEDVWRQLRTRRSFTFKELPPLELRGVPGPLGVYDVTDSGQVDDKDAAPSSHSRRRSVMAGSQSTWRPRTSFVLAVGVAGVLVGLGLIAIPHAGKPINSAMANGTPLLAVLTPRNNDSKADHAEFATGLGEAIQAQLTRPGSQLMVATPEFTAPYETRRDMLKALVRDLGVRTVVKSKAEWSGQRLRFTSTLVDAVSGRATWSQTFEREVTDPFVAQAELARDVAGALERKLAPRSDTSAAFEPDAPAQHASGSVEVSKSEVKPANRKSDRTTSTNKASDSRQSSQPMTDMRNVLKEYARGLARADTAVEIASMQIGQMEHGIAKVDLILAFKSGKPAVSWPVPYRAQLVQAGGRWTIDSFVRRY